LSCFIKSSIDLPASVEVLFLLPVGFRTTGGEGGGWSSLEEGCLGAGASF